MISSSKRIYFDVVSYAAWSIATTIGYIHSPWSKKRTKYQEVVDLLPLLQPGDILLNRTKGELTTMVIPGFWKHAAIYIGNGRLIEAVSPVVRESWLADFIMKTDCFAALRVTGITTEQQSKIVDHSKTFLGRKYDRRMRLWDETEVFCSETVYDSVNWALEKQYLELRERLGYPTFTPQDCYNARGKFTLISERC